MSRHRIVRSLDASEECDDYYSSEGHSFDDDISLSPGTEAQFTYNRSERSSIGSFLDVTDAVADISESENNSFKSFSTAQNISFAHTDTKERIKNEVSVFITNLPARKVNFDANSEKIRQLVINKTSSAAEVENQDSCISEPVVSEDQKSNVKLVTHIQNAEDIYRKERGHEKPLINLVTVGHVDAGKSTLMGHLLYSLGQVSKKTMHKFEQDSKKLGKSSFMYAWVLDETNEERNRGITMDIAQSKFETPHRCIVLLDAPGHKDFIPNMITGAAQADVAILVVDSTRGEFETGFEAGGQTREHTMLIRSLGVSQVAIAVNKMDNVNWSEERFKEIKSKMLSFLKTIGFKENDIIFVPCSGLTGENLTHTESSKLKKWYDGPTLVNVIDNLQPPQRPVEKPLRMCINDVFKGVSGGFCLAGKIESGFVKTGDKVLVMPAGERSVVKGITIDNSTVQHSFAGDQIILQLSGIDMNSVSPGSMLCDVENPVKVTSRFEARLVLFNISIPITKGFPVILHYQSICEEAVIRSLVSQLNRSTGEILKKKPRCLTKNSSAVVEIEVNRPICIELYKDFKDLGRFMLRHSGSTIGAGLVTQLK